MGITTNRIIKANCQNHECMHREILVDPEIGDTNRGIHYRLVAMRDIVLSQYEDKSILHFWGGDYDQNWGVGDITKAEKIHNSIQSIHPNRINHYAGPILLQDGSKISKSKGDFNLDPDCELLLRMIESKNHEIDLNSF